MPENSDDIKNIIYNNECALFIGAGLSEGIPKWSQLIDSMRDKIQREKGQIKPDLYYPLVASLYKRHFRAQELFKLLRKYMIDNRPEPTEAHKILMRSNVDTIITTNYDHLLEDACLDDKIVSIYRDKETVRYFEPGKKIIHMHGSIMEIENIVITMEDFVKYSYKWPLMDNLTRTLFLTKPLVIIGFSMEDLTFHNIMTYISIHAGDLSHTYFVIFVDQNKAWVNFWNEVENIKPVHLVCGDMETRNDCLTRYLKELVDNKERQSLKF